MFISQLIGMLTIGYKKGYGKFRVCKEVAFGCIHRKDSVSMYYFIRGYY